MRRSAITNLRLPGLTRACGTPQYVGFILIMIGFLFQWPTLVTLAMFPILVVMYVHLARREERDARTEFGDAYTRYEANTPAFFPKYGVRVHA